MVSKNSQQREQTGARPRSISQQPARGPRPARQPVCLPARPKPQSGWTCLQESKGRETGFKPPHPLLRIIANTISCKFYSLKENSSQVSVRLLENNRYRKTVERRKEKKLEANECGWIAPSWAVFHYCCVEFCQAPYPWYTEEVEPAKSVCGLHSCVQWEDVHSAPVSTQCPLCSHHSTEQPAFCIPSPQGCVLSFPEPPALWSGMEWSGL